MQTEHSVKSRNGQQDEQWLERLSVLQDANFAMLHFSSLFALLSLWDLICNDEFDSNSSCLDRLNNFGIISLQKVQNLPQNAISRIVGTLMCKLG